MADGDYERRDGRVAELRRLKRILETRRAAQTVLMADRGREPALENTGGKQSAGGLGAR